MTPTGVEHNIPVDDKALQAVVVKRSMTPTGVEHQSTVGVSGCQLLTIDGEVKRSMTPTGVEHMQMANETIAQIERETINDADRR